MIDRAWKPSRRSISMLRTRVIFGPGFAGPAWATLRGARLQADAARRRSRDLVAAGRLIARRTLCRSAGIEVPGFHDFDANPDTAMVEAGRAFAAAARHRLASSRSAAAARSTARRGSTSC